MNEISLSLSQLYYDLMQGKKFKIKNNKKINLKINLTTQMMIGVYQTTNKIIKN